MLRPLASALPFGFFGLVAAAALVGAEAAGFLPSSSQVAIGLLLLPTAAARLVGGGWAVLSRDPIGAALMMTFSGVWLGTGLVFITQPSHGLQTLGVWYLAICPVIARLISSATARLALSAVPAIGLPTLLATGSWLLVGGGTLGLAVGAMSFALAGAGLYAAVALLLEDSRHRATLPTLRRGPMRDAFDGGFPEPLSDLEHEAGVRRSL